MAQVQPNPIDDSPPEGVLELAPRVVVPGAVVRFAYSRSSGPGGQNVNKRSTKAELRIDPRMIPIHPGALARLLHLARGYLTLDGEVLIVADDHRSQGQNRGECLRKLRALIVAAIAIPKVRRKTRPTRSSVERRISDKKARTRTKHHRRSDGE